MKRRRTAPRPCQRCGEPKEPGRGNLYCAACREEITWWLKRKHAARQAVERQPCIRCGGPKGAGHRRRLCDRCRAEAQAPRRCKTPDCDGLPEKHKRLCRSCRETAALRHHQDYTEYRRWRQRVDPEWAERLRASRRRPPAYRMVLPEANVSPRQLAAFIRARFAASSDDAAEIRDAGQAYIRFLELAELEERAVYAWGRGERTYLTADEADAVLARLDALWWEVWNEDTVRLPALNVMRFSITSRPADSDGRERTFDDPCTGERIKFPPRRRFFNEKGERRAQTRTRLAVRQIGDLGPDRAELDRIEAVFTGRRRRVPIEQALSGEPEAIELDDSGSLADAG